MVYRAVTGEYRRWNPETAERLGRSPEQSGRWTELWRSEAGHLIAGHISLWENEPREVWVEWSLDQAVAFLHAQGLAVPSDLQASLPEG